MSRRTKSITIVAMAIAINFVAGKLAGALALPVFLDTIGTAFAGMLLGPGYGALAAIISALVSLAFGDPFSLYFCGSAIIVGIGAGLFFYGKHIKPWSWSYLWKIACISVPGSILTAAISTAFFGGITSSAGSNILIGLMRAAGFSLFQSCFIMQLIQDYADKAISIILCAVIISRLPSSFTHIPKKMKKGVSLTSYTQKKTENK